MIFENESETIKINSYFLYTGGVKLFGRKNQTNNRQSNQDNNNQQAIKWTPIFSSLSHKLIAAHQDGIIYRNTNAIFDDRHKEPQWIKIGYVEGNNVFCTEGRTDGTKILCGRVEVVGDEYHCILDFRQDKEASLEYHKRKLAEDIKHNLSPDWHQNKIKKIEGHLNEIKVAIITRITRGCYVNLSYEYRELINDLQIIPNYSRPTWMHDLVIVNQSLPYTDFNDSFGLAAAFICIQRYQGFDEFDAPFYNMYP